MIYSSRQNPKVKEIASLKDKKNRQKLGLYLAQGIKSVSEAIAMQKEIVKLVVSQDNENLFSNFNGEIIVVSNDVFNYLSDEVSPQGVMAIIKIPDLTPKAPTSIPLILDGVSDPGNLGTIIRSANAFGFKDIYLINCVDAFSNKVVKASMSGIFSVNIYNSNYDDIQNLLNDYEIVVADVNGEDINGFIPPKKFAIVMGNEANGVSNNIKSVASRFITIPMQKECESLNVAVATAIIMFKFYK